MEILPAIDLRDGAVVRLEKGDYARQTTYATDPAGIAERFARAGVNWIHVVDLDAARTGKPTNTLAVRAIRAAVDVRIELGGGVRSTDAVRAMLRTGVERVIVGSAAMEDWDWFEALMREDEFAHRVALGLDARGGKLAIHGWEEQLEATAVYVASRVRGWPLAAIIYTDIARDGMLTGVNVDATGQVIAATDVPVIASGGVGSLDDVRRCRDAGCAGVIVGRAWYEGRIDLEQALAIAQDR